MNLTCNKYMLICIIFLYIFNKGEATKSFSFRDPSLITRKHQDTLSSTVTCKVSCVYFHRKTCVANNTCGDCLSGFTGESFGNTACTGYGKLIVATVAIFSAIFILCLGFYFWNHRYARRLELAEAFLNLPTQRSVLNDSFVEEDQWKCYVCFHDNHPEKNNCVMCGTDRIITSIEKKHGSIEQKESSSISLITSKYDLEDASLNPRQKSARQRHWWKRLCTSEGYLRWIQTNPKKVLYDDRFRGTIISNYELDENSRTPKTSYVLNPKGNGFCEFKATDEVKLPEEKYKAYKIGSSLVDMEAVSSLSFKDKFKWFLKKGDELSVPSEKGNLILRIRRSHVLEDSIDQLLGVPTTMLRDRLRVDFINELGVDAGGLVREWIEEICKVVFNQSNGIFIPTQSQICTYWINTNSKEHHRNQDQVFRFFGRFIAKILLEGHVLIHHFAIPLLKHILQIPILEFDLLFLDEDIYKSYMWIKENNNTESLELNFTLSGKELKRGGEHISLNDNNKQEYLDLVLKHYMFYSVSKQLGYILQGMEDVFPIYILQVFDYQELELVLSGIPEIDIQDWKKHTVVKYIYSKAAHSKQTKMVEWFWEIIDELNVEDQARLLQYVTGTSGVPVEGFKALTSYDGRVHPFNIKIYNGNNEQTGLYPQAHTCFNRLDLPLYKTKEEMKTYLMVVIKMDYNGFTVQ